MFCPTKDRIPTKLKSNVIYKIVCPGCQNLYVGKTERCLQLRLNEHAEREDQPMYRHLIDCSDYHDYLQLFNLPNLFVDTPIDVDIKEHIFQAVHDNAVILDSNSHWSKLSFLEAYYIKLLSLSINAGLKASKELQLFR